MSEKPPYICEPQDQSAGRPATFIFLHGYSDDAEGIPLGRDLHHELNKNRSQVDDGLVGIVQQFQWHNKLPYLRWVLPNAPIEPNVRERAWYMPKALPSALKPRVPGHEEEEEQLDDDDEEGIMRSVRVLDDLVQQELDRGVEPGRIIVGGFSQGCAVSLIWGLTARLRDRVSGIVAMAGYCPLANKIGTLRKTHGWSEQPDKETEKTKWLYQHGKKDILVPTRLFSQGQSELKKWVNEDNVQAQLYENMGHAVVPPVLRDILLWLDKVIPA